MQGVFKQFDKLKRQAEGLSSQFFGYSVCKPGATHYVPRCGREIKSTAINLLGKKVVWVNAFGFEAVEPHFLQGLAGFEIRPRHLSEASAMLNTLIHRVPVDAIVIYPTHTLCTIREQGGHFDSRQCEQALQDLFYLNRHHGAALYFYDESPSPLNFLSREVCAWLRVAKQ